MSIPMDSVGAAEALKKALANGPAPPGAYDNKGALTRMHSMRRWTMRQR